MVEMDYIDRKLKPETENAFTEKYGKVLHMISEMEKDFDLRKNKLSEILNANRMKYDDFVLDVLKVSNSTFYKLLNRINNPDYADREIEYKKEGQSITDDPEVFVKTVKEAIKYYDEKRGSFIRLLRRIYARDRKKSSADEYDASMKYGGMGGLNKKRALVAKIIKQMDELAMITGETNLDKLWDYSEEKFAGIMSKEDFMRIISIKNMANSQTDEDGNEMSLEEILPDDHPETDPTVMVMTDEDTWNRLLSKAAVVFNELNKAQLVYPQSFMTRNILSELKFEVKKIDGRMKKVRYESEPAGDIEIYKLMLPSEQILWEKLFHHKYLNSAFQMEEREAPENLENVYAWLLNKDYNLTNDYIAKLFDVHKSKVSKQAKKYAEMMEELKKLDWR